MRLLLAEDEKDLSRALTAVLGHSGYEVDAAYNGQEAVELAEKNTYDAMIFDIMMPVMDGTEALRHIRASGDITPVLLLNAKSEINDRIAGLDSGADDYLTKPFAMGELLARIRSMTRRAESYNPHELKFGTVSLSVDDLELSCKNSVRLSGREGKLMSYLMMNTSKELSTADIFTHVWKDEQELGETVVWVYINYLRSKLRSINADISIIGENGGSYVLKENR